jgi:hypothetical protein
MIPPAHCSLCVSVLRPDLKARPAHSINQRNRGEGLQSTLGFCFSSNR